LKAHVVPKKRITSVTRRQHFEVVSIKFHGSQELLELEPANFFEIFKTLVLSTVILIGTVCCENRRESVSQSSSLHLVTIMLVGSMKVQLFLETRRLLQN
jgi:hypothetical protein